MSARCAAFFGAIRPIPRSAPQRQASGSAAWPRASETGAHRPGSKRSIRRQRGISAVEILVALVIGLLLTLGVSEVYLGAKQSYRLQDAQSRIQENGRYALEILSSDIRQTGYLGCPALASMTLPNDALDPMLHDLAMRPNPFPQPSGIDRPIQGIHGYDDVPANWSTADAAFPGHPFLAGWSGTDRVTVAGTDVLSILFAESCGGRVQTGATLANVVIAAGNACAINASAGCGAAAGAFCTAGDLLVISDCKSADIFRSTTGGATLTVNNAVNARDGAFSKVYGIDAELLLLHPRVYFIALNPNGDPALYRVDYTSGGAVSDEIIEGVENMQILYGVDPLLDGAPSALGDHSADHYASAINVANWPRVVSVRIALTLRSTGIDAGDNLTAAVANTPFNGGNLVDRRLRRTFSATIKLRNNLSP
jgi:type IV pilus assembly protein PilW